jgi:hypothetical protein
MLLPTPLHLTWLDGMHTLQCTTTVALTNMYPVPLFCVRCVQHSMSCGERYGRELHRTAAGCSGCSSASNRCR